MEWAMFDDKAEAHIQRLRQISNRSPWKLPTTIRVTIAIKILFSFHKPTFFKNLQKYLRHATNLPHQEILHIPQE
jgi:hypothetical protein